MNMKKTCVDIVLPVYNGERYLIQQLDSIIRQTYTNWRILIRDDKSTDCTNKIIEDYRRKYPEKIVILSDEEGNLGVTNNVLHILRHATSKYVMLCDQDDIWFPNKIKILLKCMDIKERRYGKVPILVYSDAVVADENKNIIHPSFHKYAKLNSKRQYLANILQANIFQGASCIMNDQLVEKINSANIKKLSKDLYHDWWIGAIASSFGFIFCYHKPLMYYRQHGNNILGAKHYSGLFDVLRKRDKESELYFRIRNYLYVNRTLCKELLRYYRVYLTEEQREIILFFLQSPNNMIRFFKLGLYRYYSIDNILMKILIHNI